MFEKYGGVDSVSCYPSRNYAFIYLKYVEDAIKARENRQGVVLCGSLLKIEFAKLVCGILLGLLMLILSLKNHRINL